MMKKWIVLFLVILMLTPAFAAVQAAEAAGASSQGNDIVVYLDGYKLDRGVTPVIRNGYTLLPIRPIAEAMGADVLWDDATRTTTLIRASKEIKLTIDQNTALINGETVSLDVGAALIDGRTMLPLRFVAEQFSQVVVYNPEQRAVYIAEDMSFDVDKDFVQWMLGCGAILAKANNDDPFCIGMAHRAWGYSSEYTALPAGNVGAAGSPRSKTLGRQFLAGSWNCNSREELIDTILRMTLFGHNDNFLYDVALINSLSEQDFNALVEMSTGVDKFMWPYVKALGEKWGETGIGAWDWFRMTHLAGWGYIAGYLELSEAYALAQPSIALLKAVYSSWDEAVDNYMDGYAYWSRIDVNQPSTTYQRRLAIYEDLKADQHTRDVLFDPSVWK